MQRCLYSIFQNQTPIFCCPLFSENYLNSQVRINKLINKHTVDYHPSPSQLISRIQPPIFLWTPKGFIYPESFSDFFLKLYIPPWLWESFRFMLLSLLANTFVSQKIESAQFYSFFIALKQNSPSGFYHHHPQAEGNYPFLPNNVFWRYFFLSRKGGGVGRWLWLKKFPKLNLRGYWSQVSINPTILATFTFLIHILLCHNLASSMLKCEGSLT